MVRIERAGNFILILLPDLSTKVTVCKLYLYARLVRFFACDTLKPTLATFGYFTIKLDIFTSFLYLLAYYIIFML